MKRHPRFFAGAAFALLAVAYLALPLAQSRRGTENGEWRYLGGDVGPDLTAIGTIRSERDLLEAVVYPSASLVRSYEPWLAATRDGEEHSGVLRRDTPDEIVLATGPGAEVRIARADLAELRLSQVSTMPAGLEEQLSRQELADLLAFLMNTKWGVN
jgi:putative heme-binding domain-containing protein